MRRKHRYLLYEVTRRCQNDCVFCYNVWKEVPDYPAGELSTADAIRMLGKVVDETGCEFIGLTGGEPLLRPDVLEIASYLSSRKVLPVLISNGQLLTRDRIAACLDSGVSYFEVSLHGHRPEVHDSLAGRKGSFEEVVQAILDIKELGGKVNTVFVATASNIGAFREYVELTALLRVDWILFNRVACGGTCVADWEALAPPPEAVQRALDEGLPVAEKYHLGLSAGVQIQPCLIDLSRYPGVKTSFCPLNDPDGSSSYFAIDPAGNLRMCNRSRIILGNLLTEPFARIAETAEAQAFCAAVPEFCRGCAIAARCAGGCKADAFSRYGSLAKADPYLEKYRERAKRL